MGLFDYVLLRSPDARLNGKKQKQLSGAGEISKVRIAFALIGCILGIVMSFIVTDVLPGLRSRSNGQGVPAAASSAAPDSDAATGQAARRQLPPVKLINAGEMRSIVIVTFVIFMLTFPILYRQLNLYANEPAFLIIFVAFQAGYFWNSLVDGAAKAWVR